MAEAGNFRVCSESTEGPRVEGNETGGGAQRVVQLLERPGHRKLRRVDRSLAAQV